MTPTTFFELPHKLNGKTFFTRSNKFGLIVFRIEGSEEVFGSYDPTEDLTPFIENAMATS